MGAFSDSIGKENSIPLVDHEGGVDGSDVLIFGLDTLQCDGRTSYIVHTGKDITLDIWRN
jgi:hypothetical protein